MAQKAYSSETCRVATGIYEEIGEVRPLGKRNAGIAIVTCRLASLLSLTVAKADSGKSSTGAAIAVSAPGARLKKVSSLSKMIDEEKSRFASVSPASIASVSGMISSSSGHQ